MPDAVVRARCCARGRRRTALALGEPEIDERLAPGASPEDVRDAALGRGETVVVVGHQPDCGRRSRRSPAAPSPVPARAAALVEIEL